MTQYFPFTPNAAAVPPYQFAPTLDGQVYNVYVTWNVFGQRWYINVYDLTGELVLSTPTIGSPSDYDISLVWGIFTSTLVFRESSQQFEVSP